jgi:FkbM family methyltransferase
MIEKITLPELNRVYCYTEEEASLLYQQILDYFKNGIIIINKNDVILDIGANIGLFSLWLSRLQNNLNIYAFEPIPTLFEILKINAEEVSCNAIKPFCLGLSNSEKEIEFTYYPHCSAISTYYPDESLEEINKFKKAIDFIVIQDPQKYKIFSFLPSRIKGWIYNRKAKSFFRESEKIKIQTTTISEVIKKHNLSQINLLKIDVEKSELDVIEGINLEDWCKIKQVVIEVHNLEDRLLKIKDLLKANNFKNIIVEQEEIFKSSNSDIYTIYATK